VRGGCDHRFHIFEIATIDAKDCLRKVTAALLPRYLRNGIACANSPEKALTTTTRPVTPFTFLLPAGVRAFNQQLLEIDKHCVLPVCAIKNVKAVRSAAQEIGTDEICQFLLDGRQGDVTAAGQLADIHLAARINEQRAGVPCAR
jgi:hypothetical protein